MNYCKIFIKTFVWCFVVIAFLMLCGIIIMYALNPKLPKVSVLSIEDGEFGSNTLPDAYKNDMCDIRMVIMSAELPVKGKDGRDFLHSFLVYRNKNTMQEVALRGQWQDRVNVKNYI